MKFAQLLAALLFVLPASAVLAGGKPVPLVEPSIVLPALEGQTQTAESVRGFIKTAATEVKSGSLPLGVVVDSDEPGLLTLTFNKQERNYFTLAVSYNATGYQLKYVSSRNLDYAERDGARLIHRNYPVWINNFVNQITAAQNAAANKP